MFAAHLTPSGLSHLSPAPATAPSSGRHFVVAHSDHGGLLVSFEDVSYLGDLTKAWAERKGTAIALKEVDSNMAIWHYCDIPPNIVITVDAVDAPPCECCVPLCGKAAKATPFTCFHPICKECYKGIIRCRHDAPGNENVLGALCPLCRAERSAEQCPSLGSPETPICVDELSDEDMY